jgi:hypothetical protein
MDFRVSASRSMSASIEMPEVVDFNFDRRLVDNVY